MDSKADQNPYDTYVDGDELFGALRVREGLPVQKVPKCRHCLN